MNKIECNICGLELPPRDRSNEGLSDSLIESLRQIDLLVKLHQVENILSLRMAVCPTRPTIISWIKSGILEGLQIGRGGNWYVSHSSLDRFISESQSPSQQKLAA